MPKPGDPYKTRLEGELVGFTFRSDDGAFAVARLKDEGGDEHVLVGPIAHLCQGVHLRVEGQRSEHPRFGTRIKVRSYLVEDPRTLNGLRRYLASGSVKGLGKELAERVVDAFGLETLSILDRSPQRLREVSGIGPKRVERILEHWGRDRAQRELSVMLRGHGLGAAITRRVLDRYGDEAMAIVTRDPYRMAGEIPGVAFRTADAMARGVGIAEDDPRRSRALVRWLLSEAAKQGHCFLPDGELEERALALHGTPERIREAVGALALEARVAVEEVTGTRRIWESQMLATERRVAERLATRSRRVEVDPAVASAAAERQGIDLAPEQLQAVSLGLGSRLCVITGGPGTGKTTLVRVLLEAALRRGERWLLAAPTGRAAQRLSESCGVEARTIHRLLGYNPGKGGFTRNADNPLECDAVLVDEVSMVDLGLMDRLTEALPSGTRLVLVGDADQLPSVGPGCVLGDLIASGAVPVVRLSQVFRQEGGSGIVRNAHRILQGEFPVSSEREETDRKDFYLLAREEPDAILETLLEVITRRLPAQGYNPLADIQVLTPMHKGPLGSRALNTALQDALNPHGQEMIRGERRLRVGDRVLQNRNDYDNEIFNGDIGIIRSMEGGGVEVDFSGRRVALVGDQLDSVTLAYAISIHKSQGSEYPAVLCLFHTGHFVMLRRNLLYTAVTRARRFCCVLGSHRAIGLALRRTEGHERHTGLAQRLSGG